MVHYHRYYQLKKFAELDEESHALVLECPNHGYFKRTRPKLLSLLFLSLLSCSLVLAPQFFDFPSTFSLFYSSGADNEALLPNLDLSSRLCSSISNGSICCDRSSIRSDICFMKGNIRTHSSSASIIVYNSRPCNQAKEEIEKIKPYTRKWESSVMNTIGELNLISKEGKSLDDVHSCDLSHDVPAVFFSTGGYTGNVYHEFNDGILPLYVTSQHFNKKVVFVILEYHNWWVSKYGDILSHLSDYPPIDFNNDPKTYCFSEVIVGLRIHDELTINPSLMVGNKSLIDFRDLLNRAYWPRIRGLIQDEERLNQRVILNPSKPKMVILSRNGSRSITNEDQLVKMGEEMGFQVTVLRPDRSMELAKTYRELNLSDVMVGVHGAAMTHFLFLKPGSVFIQVIPLGTEWAAEAYYGEPSRKLGLKYMGYKILPRESSLYENYDRNDPVLSDPDSVTKKGWEFTKKIYLDGQNVRLDLNRFRKRLVRAYYYSISKKGRSRRQLQ